jgi:hypothetical protein
MPHWTQRLEASADRALMSGALESAVYPVRACNLANSICEIPFSNVNDSHCTEAQRSLQSGTILSGSCNYRRDALRTKKLQTHEPDWSWSRHNGRLANTNRRYLCNRVYGRSERFTQRCLFHRQSRGDPKELIGAHYNVSRKGAVYSVAHAASRRTEDEIT